VPSEVAVILSGNARGPGRSILLGASAAPGSAGKLKSANRALFLKNLNV
jgi:hypothetical protein